MPTQVIRTTISFRPNVAKWQDREKADRQAGDGPDELPSDGAKVSRDAIVGQSIVLLSHVQNADTMAEIFGREGLTVRTKLLEFLSSNQDPSE